MVQAVPGACHTVTPGLVLSVPAEQESVLGDPVTNPCPGNQCLDPTSSSPCRNGGMASLGNAEGNPGLGLLEGSVGSQIWGRGVHSLKSLFAAFGTPECFPGAAGV